MKIITLALVLAISVLMITTNEARDLPYRRLDDWYREVNREKRCFLNECKSDDNCCSKYECWVVPATCIRPKGGITGWCFPEQVHC